MKQKNKFVNNVKQVAKRVAFTALVYSVLIAAVFFYAAISMLKLWLLPASIVAFTFMSAWNAYEEHEAFNSYIEAFNRRLVELVTRYIEVGTN